MKKLYIFALMLLSVAISAVEKSEQVEVTNKTALEGFSATQTRQFKQEFNVASALSVNPLSVWFHAYVSRLFPTAHVPRRQPVAEIPSKIMPEVGKVTAKTALGDMSLDDFVSHPKGYVHGVIIVHKGNIVYEKYPGMKEADSRLTASVAKVFTGLLIERLIEEEVIDEQKVLGDYVPDFHGSAWEKVKIADAMDMTTGLDPTDGPAHFSNPDSVVTRMLMAELGQPRNGEVESMLNVLRDAKPVSKPGEYWRYSSTATQALVVLAEAVTGQALADAFDQRIWSKMGVEGALQMHLSPDGYALGHGIFSLRLRDLARFGMLYTPSQEKIAIEPVVTQAILERTTNIKRSRGFYRSGPSAESFIRRLGDDSMSTAGRQWDAIWDDGDFYKSGLNNQMLYVSPKRDLVIAYFAVDPTFKLQKYLRPIVTSGVFDE